MDNDERLQAETIGASIWLGHRAYQQTADPRTAVKVGIKSYFYLSGIFALGMFLVGGLALSTSGDGAIIAITVLMLGALVGIIWGFFRMLNEPAKQADQRAVEPPPIPRPGYKPAPPTKTFIQTMLGR